MKAYVAPIIITPVKRVTDSIGGADPLVTGSDPSARVRGALPVQGRRLHAYEPDVRHVVEYRRDDRVAGNPGLHGRRHDPDGFCHRHDCVSAFAPAADLDLIGLVATLAPTVGPTVGGYLTAVVALAVFHQCAAGHRRHASQSRAD